MRNKDIRQAAAASGVRLWRVAEKLEMTDTSFSKMLRHELPSEKKQEILAVIDEIAAEGDN